MAKFYAEKIFCLHTGAYVWDSPCVVASYQFDCTPYREYPLRVDVACGSVYSAFFRAYTVFKTVSSKAVLSGHIDTVRPDLLQSVVVYRFRELFYVRLSGSMDGNAASASSGRRIDGGDALF